MIFFGVFVIVFFFDLCNLLFFGGDSSRLIACLAVFFFVNQAVERVKVYVGVLCLTLVFMVLLFCVVCFVVGDSFVEKVSVLKVFFFSLSRMVTV